MKIKYFGFSYCWCCGRKKGYIFMMDCGLCDHYVSHERMNACNLVVIIPNHNTDMGYLI